MNGLQLLFSLFMLFVAISIICVVISHNSVRGSMAFNLAELLFIASIILALIVAFVMFLYCIFLIILFTCGLSIVMLP
jgi:hypothetical protein